MDIVSAWNLRRWAIPISPKLRLAVDSSCLCKLPPCSAPNLSLPVWAYPFAKIPKKSSAAAIYAKKRNSKTEPVLKPTIIEEVAMDDEEDEDEQLLFDDLDNDVSMDDGDYFEEEDMETETDLYIGDGAGGGGISLAGTWWDEEALAVAEGVCKSFEGDLGIYAFKTLSNSSIQVRIERLTNKSGSPSMEDIEAFSVTYRTRLDEAQLEKSVPENISLEVSSPGVERVVRIPQDLDRFKDRPMYVKYVGEVAATGSPLEGDGVFKLVSFDIETKSCTWGLADVRINREKAGKGRPLSKKQREWRLETTFDSLLLVQLYSEI